MTDFEKVETIIRGVKILFEKGDISSKVYNEIVEYEMNRLKYEYLIK